MFDCCQNLLQNHGQLWTEATANPFLALDKTETLQPHLFDRWLEQDYQLVVALTRMVGRSLGVAPVEDFALLLDGLGALQNELRWFRAKGSKHPLTLTAPLQPASQTYCQLLDALTTHPYAVQAIAFWTIMGAFNQAWQHPGPIPELYEEFANRWGNLELTDYIQLLEQQADEAIQDSSGDAYHQAETIFVQVMEVQREFLRMAFTAKVV